jgi:hypothetical protein
VAAGEDLAATVDRVVAHDRHRLTDVSLDPPAPETGGIDFIECFGCDPLPGGEGFPLTLLGLVAAGTPLAFRAFAARRRARAGLPVPDSGVAQNAGVVMAASLVVSTWTGPLLLTVQPHDAGSLVVFAVGAMGIANVVLGLPAVYAWREVYAHAFARQTPMLRLG